jgi:hypothetical protein
MPSLLLNNHGSCQPIISSSAHPEALRLMFIWTSSLSATDRIAPWPLAFNRLIIGCNSARRTSLRVKVKEKSKNISIILIPAVCGRVLEIPFNLGKKKYVK